MRHPFDLNLDELTSIDLEFAEELTDEESAHISGSSRHTTKTLMEEGRFLISNPKQRPPRLRPIEPPEATTLALGEEGGEWATTLALGEEGGEVTTMAIGEEGGFQIQ